MSNTLRDLISDNLEFDYQIDWDTPLEDTRFDYQFKIKFKERCFEHKGKGGFIMDILNGDPLDSVVINNDIREMILDKCEELLS